MIGPYPMVHCGNCDTWTRATDLTCSLCEAPIPPGVAAAAKRAHRVQARAERLYYQEHHMRAPAGFAHFYPSWGNLNRGTQREYLARAEKEEA